MIIIRQHRIYRKDLRANPDILYLFGDNLDRKGMGGQAAEMRGEPNAFGIATKRSISHNFPDDYFFDSQVDVKGIIDEEFWKLHSLLKLSTFRPGEEISEYVYRAVIIPLDGLGTGLAKMPELAPNMLNYLNKKLEELEQL